MELDLDGILETPADLGLGTAEWSSEAEYLTRQYKLLREDFCRPLRQDLVHLLSGRPDKATFNFFSYKKELESTPVRYSSTKSALYF